MAAVIRRNLVWTQGRGVSDVYAMIETDDAAHFEPNAGIYSDSLADYWLVHYRDGRFVSAQKIPTKDILWELNIEHAPFGRGHTLVFRKGKSKLSDVWSDVLAGGNPSFRFFTVEVVLP